MDLEQLKAHAPRIIPMGFKVNETEQKEVNDFLDTRNLKKSTFLRLAVMEAIAKIKNDERKDEV